ncbi:MAG TPA: cytochrome b/b6 domain-containing protein [Caulobacteraceae bacterium]|jgi:cytochrome b561
MQPRYSTANQVMHWITAICMLALLPIAWVMVNTRPQGPYVESLFNWHKTLGAIVLIVTAIRIVWRFVDPPPPYPPAIAPWERAVAQTIYWLFFAVLIWMPVTGLMASTFGGHATRLFDVLPTPLLMAPDKHLAGVFAGLHLWGQWAVYALIGLHLSAVAMHLIWRRDGVLGRMLPANAAEPGPAWRPAPGRPATHPGHIAPAE